MAPLLHPNSHTFYQLGKFMSQRPPSLASPSTIHCRSYYRLLRENPTPFRLMQGFNTTSTTPITTHSSFHTSAPPASPPIDLLTFPQSEPQSTTTDSTTTTPGIAEVFRIPILPTNNAIAHEAPVEEAIIKPEIHTVSADAVGGERVSVMGAGRGGVELEDGLRTVEDVVEEKKGVLRELWSGLMDDVLGERKVKV